MEYRLRDIIKTHGKGLVRRGCPKPFWPVRCRPAEGAGRLPKRTAVAGQPAVKFNHSPFLSNGGGLRATNHEPRATAFSMSRGGARRYRPFEFDAAQRHLSPWRPANCEQRGRQAPKTRRTKTWAVRPKKEGKRDALRNRYRTNQPYSGHGRPSRPFLRPLFYGTGTGLLPADRWYLAGGIAGRYLCCQRGFVQGLGDRFPPGKMDGRRSLP